MDHSQPPSRLYLGSAIEMDRGRFRWPVRQVAVGDWHRCTMADSAVRSAPGRRGRRSRSRWQEAPAADRDEWAWGRDASCPGAPSTAPACGWCWLRVRSPAADHRLRRVADHSAGNRCRPQGRARGPGCRTGCRPRSRCSGSAAPTSPAGWCRRVARSRRGRCAGCSPACRRSRGRRSGSAASRTPGRRCSAAGRTG